jgi:hypothetical protein
MAHPGGEGREGSVNIPQKVKQNKLCNVRKKW